MAQRFPVILCDEAGDAIRNGSDEEHGVQPPKGMAEVKSDAQLKCWRLLRCDVYVLLSFRGVDFYC